MGAGIGAPARQAVHREHSALPVHPMRSQGAIYGKRSAALPVHRMRSPSAVHGESSALPLHRMRSRGAMHGEHSALQIHRMRSQSAVHGEHSAVPFHRVSTLSSWPVPQARCIERAPVGLARERQLLRRQTVKSRHRWHAIQRVPPSAASQAGTRSAQMGAAWGQRVR